MHSLVLHHASRRGVIGPLHRTFLIATACGESSQGAAAALCFTARPWEPSPRKVTTDAAASSSPPPPAPAPTNGDRGKGRKKDRKGSQGKTLYTRADREGNSTGSKDGDGRKGPQAQSIKAQEAASGTGKAKTGEATGWKGKDKETSEASSGQGGQGDNGVRGSSSAAAGPASPTIDKVARLAVLTARVEAARADQPDLAFHPGLTGPAAFDTVPLVFPPKSVYPPPYPVVIARDLQMTSIALGVNRWASPVVWSEDKRTGEIKLKSTAMLPNRPEEEGREWLFADERNLEWVGDAVISLVMRTQLETTYPDLSVAGKTISVGRLVANDLLGHLWDESGLEAERLRVAQMLLEEEAAKAKADAIKRGVPPERWPEDHGIKLRVEEITRHGSKADHFESYVGACFWTLGWEETERWVQALAAPYIERIARVDNGQFLESHMTRVGEVSKRIQDRKMNEQRKLEEQQARSRIETMGPIRKRAREFLRPLASFLFPEVGGEPKGGEEPEAQGARAGEDEQDGKGRPPKGKKV